MKTLRPRRVALALGAALLSGCSMIPIYQRPAAPVANEWLAPAATAGKAAADLPWQEFFGNDRLRRLIATAIANNRDLRVAVLNIEQARAQYDIRRADLLPTVAGAANAARAPNGNGKIANTYTVGLGFSAWEIDLFGRLASLSQAALAQYLGTEEGRKAAQTSLISSVATTWLAVLADDELLKLTGETLTTREQSLRLVKLRFDNGVTSELELRQAESLVETARATLAQFARQRSVDLDALALLLGQPVPQDFTIDATTATVTFPDVPAGTPSEVLVQRPDVRQAEQQLIAANANIGAARAAFFPHISLTSAFGTGSGELSGLFKGGSWAFTASAQLAQPIFDAGRNRAGLASANVSRDIAIAQYERAIQSAFREVSDALAGRATFGEQLRAQAAVVEATAATYRLSELRYNNGVASYLDLLDAQRALFAAQQALVQTRLQDLQNQVLLYRALGGGWSAG